MQEDYSNDEISDISEDSVGIDDELASFESQIEQEVIVCKANGVESRTGEILESPKGPAVHCSHPDNPDYTCKTCAKSFHELNDLVRHIETHNRWRFKCAVCGIYLKSKSILNVHQQRHRAERHFICEICEKSFVTGYELQAHIKTHREAPIRYRCDICGKDFGRIYTLKSHLNIHDPVPEHKCDECGKIFPKRRNLLLHERTHLVKAVLNGDT